MSLSENIKKCFDAAEELLKEAPQTIEVRGCQKWLRQAQGSLAQAGDLETIEEVREVISTPPEQVDVVEEEIITGSEETSTSVDIVEGSPVVEPSATDKAEGDNPA